MNGKQSKRLRKLAREMGLPYKKLKEAYRGGAVKVVKK